MREEIIRMAREAGALVGIKHMTDSTGEMIVFDPDDLERFAALVAAAKKEECAQEAEGITKFIRYQSKEHYKFASVIAAAIRALP